MDRFEFQRQCVNKTSGKVLNAGCKEDPANLKRIAPDRIFNLDIGDYDKAIFAETGEKKLIPVDIIWDMTKIHWPFKDNEFELVVLGDILEDLPNDYCQIDILQECHRIAKAVCITTPNDKPERDAHHLTNITEERLKHWLEYSNFEIVEFHKVDYGFVPEGYLVYAIKGGDN